MFKNLTQHAVRIKGWQDGARVTKHIPPCGTVATVATIMSVPVTRHDGDFIFHSRSRCFGAVQNLPDPEKGVVLIVSSMVLDRVADRDDVIAPDTGPTAVRVDGQVEAVMYMVDA